MVRIVRDPIFWLAYCFERRKGWCLNPDHGVAP